MKSQQFKLTYSSFEELRALKNGIGIKRYHRTIGFPSELQLPKGIINFRFSNHAKEAIKDDKYSKESLKVSSYLNLAYAEIFEVIIENNALKKFVCKTPYNETHDISMSIAIYPNQVFLLCTCWLNEKGDNHKSLNKLLYDKP